MTKKEEPKFNPGYVRAYDIQAQLMNCDAIVRDANEQFEKNRISKESYERRLAYALVERNRLLIEYEQIRNATPVHEEVVAVSRLPAACDFLLRLVSNSSKEEVLTEYEEIYLDCLTAGHRPIWAKALVWAKTLGFMLTSLIRWLHYPVDLIAKIVHGDKSDSPKKSKD